MCLINTVDSFTRHGDDVVVCGGGGRHQLGDAQKRAGPTSQTNVAGQPFIMPGLQCAFAERLTDQSIEVVYLSAANANCCWMKKMNNVDHEGHNWNIDLLLHVLNA